MIRLLLVLSLVIGAGAPASADRRTNSIDNPQATSRREAIKKKIRALRAYALTEELSLDEQTAGRLFPVLAKWDDVTDKLLVQRVNLASQLRAADQLRDPKALERLIDDALANQKAFWELEDKRLAELRKILTPLQTARLLVVLPEFERRIQNQLKRAIQKRAPGAGRARNRLEDDVDDDVEADELPGPQAPRTGPARRAPAPAAGTPKCDPFTSLHGCASTTR